MSLAPGTQLGPYEVLALIGAGGMGEVYRARDSRLKRDVALKVLPAAFVHEPERLARFSREAEVLASLNHPNIAAIYGVEEGALVMELVEGETLAEVIRCGAVPLETALEYAGQIAAALDAAHEKGIVHRDLKPANVKITPEGRIKVLDFGLAAVVQGPASASAADATNSPTLTLRATQAGVVLGTAAYMAPEQARGRPVDKRADIWAFGVLLCEMLTGRPAFTGEDITEILASAVKDKPDLSRLPQKVRPLLERCLEKDPKKRLRDIGDAWFLLEEVGQVAGLAEAQVPARRRWLWLSSGAAALFLVIAGSVSFVHYREKPLQRAVLRYTIPAPENTTNLHSFAISPDGRYVAMAADVKGTRQLWLRPLDALQAKPMPFTDGAYYPFWSPDSRYIGFFTDGKLKKVAVSGGPSQSLCDLSHGFGGSWNRGDVIVFSRSGAGGAAIQRVSEAGGVPVDVTKRMGSSVFPVFMPDGHHFLYLLVSVEQNGVYLSSLDGREDRRILTDESSVAFAAGRLLFIRENTLVVQSFDYTSSRPLGEVFPIAEGVSVPSAYYAPVTVSETGVLLYQSGARAPHNQLAWYDRAGKLLGAVSAVGSVWDPVISPDEKSVVFARTSGPGSDLWLRDLARGAEQRFTTDASSNRGLVWSPKGDRIVFGSTRGGRNYNLYQKAAGRGRMSCCWRPRTTKRRHSGPGMGGSSYIRSLILRPRRTSGCCRWRLGRSESRLPFCARNSTSNMDSSRPTATGWRIRQMNRESARCMCGRSQAASFNRRFRSPEASSPAGAGMARSCFLWEGTER
jgi:serine/threonine protein kinase